MTRFDESQHPRARSGEFTTKERPETGVHLHIGVKPADMPLVERMATAIVGDEAIAARGDSWKSWGEQRDADEASHVVIEAPDSRTARVVANVLSGAGTTPASDDDSAEWVVTDSQDWTQVLETAPARPDYADEETALARVVGKNVRGAHVDAAVEKAAKRSALVNLAARAFVAGRKKRKRWTIG